MGKQRIRLVINLEAEMLNDHMVHADVLNVMISRAESFAARVLLCGDKGGKLLITEEPGPNGVEACAIRVTVLPGNMTATRAEPKRPRTKLRNKRLQASHDACAADLGIRRSR